MRSSSLTGLVVIGSISVSLAVVMASGAKLIGTARDRSVAAQEGSVSAEGKEAYFKQQFGPTNASQEVALASTVSVPEKMERQYRVPKLFAPDTLPTETANVSQLSATTSPKITSDNGRLGETATPAAGQTQERKLAQSRPKKVRTHSEERKLIASLQRQYDRDLEYGRASGGGVYSSYQVYPR